MGLLNVLMNTCQMCPEMKALQKKRDFSNLLILGVLYEGPAVCNFFHGSMTTIFSLFFSSLLINNLKGSFVILQNTVAQLLNLNSELNMNHALS